MLKQLGVSKLSFIAVILLLTACDGSERHRVFGNYYLTAVDIEENTAFEYQGEGWIVAPAVYAVGYNDKYFILKQHPNPTYSDHLDKRIINYYILRIKNGYHYPIKNELTGPMNKTEFEQKKKELNLGEIEFTMVNKDLE